MITPEYQAIRDRVADDLRGPLTREEYRELITLEYVLTHYYAHYQHEEARYIELSRKRHSLN